MQSDNGWFVREVFLVFEKRCLIISSDDIKGTGSPDFQPFFLLKRLYLSPIRTGKNGFVNFFVFAQVDKNNSKSCDSVPLTKVIYCDHLHLNTI